MSRLLAGSVEMQPLEGRTLLSAAPVTLSYHMTAAGRELKIIGTDADESITVIRRTGGLRITSSNGFYAFWRRKTELMRIEGGGGNDRITVKWNVLTPSILFGGDGNDTLAGGGGADRLYGGDGDDVAAGFNGDDVIVSVGDGGNDRNYGGDGTDSYWVDAQGGDLVMDVSSDEVAAGALHSVYNFSAGGNGDHSIDAVHAIIGADPILTDTATGYGNFSNRPLFSKWGPGIADIKQGSIGDCYLLASLASLARTNPQIIRQSMVDLGDGTYAVQFVSRGDKVFVRVDGDLPTTSIGQLAYAQLGRQQSLWVAVFEKAYALFRNGSAAYGSLEGGFMGEVYEDMGLPNNSVFSYNSGQNLLNSILSDLRAGKAVTLATNHNISGTTALADHAYSVDRVITDSDGIARTVRLYNPWARDGAGRDGSDDGYVTLSGADAMQVFWFACTARV